MIKNEENCKKCEFDLFKNTCAKYGNCEECPNGCDLICKCLEVKNGDECKYFTPLIGENNMEELLKNELEIYKLKNQKYGNSFDKSVEKYGLTSALTRMSDKWNRIENLILTHDAGTNDESLKDSLMDLANYCNMTVLILNKME